MSNLLFAFLFFLSLLFLLLQLKNFFKNQKVSFQREIERLKTNIQEMQAEWQQERKSLCEKVLQKQEEFWQMQKEMRKQPPPQEVLPKEVKEMQDLYKQLRVQFDEKNEHLHLARQEVFKLEGKLLALQKEKEQEEHAHNAHLESALDYALKEKEFLEQEVLHLEEIITTVSHG